VPHIDLGNDAPGIVSLLMYRPDTARPLSELAEIVLRGDSTLSRGERELIAARVSTRNACGFCASSHAAFAALQLPEGMELVAQVRADPDAAALTPKMRALLRIADAVQTSGRDVSAEHVKAAHEAGATDREIHDTVLIAAMFCMYNRYVDGLATLTPEDPADYEAGAERIVKEGYVAGLAGA
jgi:uncharacterized peroxidase-related enzyme